MKVRGNRQKIREWRKILSELSASNKSDDPLKDIQGLYSLDIAHIENGIYGLAAMFGLEKCKSIVKQTLRDIANAYGDLNHWRNRENL